jgi:hypothetical protein
MFEIADSGRPRKRADGAGGRTQITALCMEKRSGPETCSGVAHGPLESPSGWQPVTVAEWRRAGHLAARGPPHSAGRGAGRGFLAGA